MPPQVQLSPYNRVQLMRIPVIQNFLKKLLTVDLPALMVLPKRLEINIPPSITSVAEQAVGRDVIMRAVASAVLEVGGRELWGALRRGHLLCAPWCKGLPADLPAATAVLLLRS